MPTSIRASRPGSRNATSQPWNTRPPLQERSRATLERFATAAEELLREKSFEEITVQEIARRAGRPIGSFYARFPGKESLLPFLYERYDQSLEATFHARLAEVDWEELELAATVDRLVQLLISLYENRRWLLRALALFARQHPDALSEELISRRRRIYDGIAEALLRHRHEITHEDPEEAIRFGIYVVSAAARDSLLFSDAPHARVTAISAARLRRELAGTFLGYLTVRRS
jgi:AcrR family transcriptional regulator